jgi:HSP20 family protein
MKTHATETTIMVDIKALIPWRNTKSDVATKRDDFFDPFVSFRREMDRMFDRFFDGLPASTGTAWQALIPAADVDETDKEMVITVELPGVSDKDVEVSLVGDVLTIKGEKKSEKEHKDGDSAYVERRFGSFTRSVRLPFEVKDGQVDARFKDGVLTINVPKPRDMQRSVRRIAVKSA